MLRYAAMAGGLLIAEELDAPFEQISVRQLPLELMASDGGLTWKFAPQGSGGSYSIVSHFDRLRQAGALARALLIAAAARWAVPAERLTTADAHVLDPETGERMPYGALADDAATPPPASPSSPTACGRP